MEVVGTNSAERGQPDILGRTIAGKFRVESYLGGGAMGAVYKARQIALDKDVAIKLLHGQHASDATFAARFHREAKAASKLDHPNSVRIIDFGQEPDGLLYIAMEFLDGRDLFHVIREDWPLPAERVTDILSQALAAISVAHDMGVVHRDLKPENIMVQRGTDDEGHQRDVVKVCDFGIAKFTDLRQEARAGDAGQKLTSQGLVVGTPEYMSPEQAKGEALDARSDLYSVGVILYQLLTGRVPFDAETALAVVLKHVMEDAVPPRTVNPFADERLEAVCLKAMSKKREDRYQTGREMRAALKGSVGASVSAALAATIPIAASSSSPSISSPSGTPALSSPSLHSRATATDPHAATAVAIDSGSVAAAAVQSAAMKTITASSMTRAGTAAVRLQGEPSRGRGWALALLVVLALGGGAGFWVMRTRFTRAPVVGADEPRIVVAPPLTTLKPLRAETDLPPLEPLSSASGKAATLPPVAPERSVAPAALATHGPATTAPAAPTAVAPPVPPPVEPPLPAPVAPASTPAVATPAPATASAPAVPAAPVAFDPAHAHIEWAVVSTGGGATAGSVQRAVSRKIGQWTHCYRTALQRRAERIEGGGVLHLTTDESGNVVGARMAGFDAMPGVKSCIVSDSHVHFDNVDTGDAWADVQLTFRAE